MIFLGKSKNIKKKEINVNKITRKYEEIGYKKLINEE